MRLGEEVLHRLERSDGDAELPTLRGVVDRDPQSASHRAHEIRARQRESERSPCGEVVRRQGRALVGDDLDGHANRDCLDGACQIGACARRIRGVEQQASEMTAGAVWVTRQEVRDVRLVAGIDGVRGGGGSLAGHDGGARQRRRDCHRAGLRQVNAGPPPEIGRQDRARERRVGDMGPQGFGHDGCFDGTRDGRAAAGVITQFQPAGVAYRARQPLRAGGVVEVGDRGRRELAGQLPGRAAQLGLLGGVTRVHRW